VLYSSAPLGPEDQGGFRFPPLDPLDSYNPLKTTGAAAPDPGDRIILPPLCRGEVSRKARRWGSLFRNTNDNKQKIYPSVSLSADSSPLRRGAKIALQGSRGIAPGRFRGVMGVQREVGGKSKSPLLPLALAERVEDATPHKGKHHQTEKSIHPSHVQPPPTSSVRPAACHLPLEGKA